VTSTDFLAHMQTLTEKVVKLEYELERKDIVIEFLKTQLRNKRKEIVAMMAKAPVNCGIGDQGCQLAKEHLETWQ